MRRIKKIEMMVALQDENIKKLERILKMCGEHGIINDVDSKIMDLFSEKIAMSHVLTEIDNRLEKIEKKLDLCSREACSYCDSVKDDDIDDIFEGAL